MNIILSQVKSEWVSIGFYLLSIFVSRAFLNRVKYRKLRLKNYRGSCHCGKITFQVNAPSHLVVFKCNCSICYMKKNDHFICPNINFELNDDSKSYLNEYQFNTMVAKHMFCKICGVEAFYHPRLLH